MQNYLIMKRIMDIINGRVSMKDENVTTFALDKNHDINEIDRNIKNLIDSAVKKYGFFEILIELSSLNVSLSCRGFKNTPIYSYSIADLQNRIISYYMPEVYVKSLFLLSMDQFDSKKMAKKVLTPSFSLESLLGLNASQKVNEELDQESIFDEDERKSKRGYTFKFSDIAAAMRLRDKTKAEFFNTITKMFSLEEIKVRINQAFEILSSSSEEYVIIFSTLFMHACNELLDYIQSKEECFKEKSSSLQLTLPGYN